MARKRAQVSLDADPMAKLAAPLAPAQHGAAKPGPSTACATEQNHLQTRAPGAAGEDRRGIVGVAVLTTCFMVAALLF